MDFLQRFSELDALLVQHRDLWQNTPFKDTKRLLTHRPSAYQELYAHLLSLNECALAELQHNPGAPAWRKLCQSVSGLDALAPLCTLDYARGPALNLPELEGRDIRGRKWRQVQQFVSAVIQDSEALPWLDWCSGKGHLGRLLNRITGRPTLCLEYDPQLCMEGALMAEHQGLDVRFCQQDVLQPLGSHIDPGDHHCVALHACGELHTSLLRQAQQHGFSTISLSPCCYHRTTPDDYQPLSRRARSSPLTLRREHLALAVQESVTGSPREQAKRKAMCRWRLGFDELQRELTGVDEYLPTPSLPVTVLRGDFASFCQRLAALKGMPLPDGIDFDQFEELGKQRFFQVERLEVARHLFRRPLELWLVLDYCLYLREEGYHVTLREFCERHLTPRNLLLQARKSRTHHEPVTCQ